MTTIVTIQSADLIANSRADLNTNFANLNAGKVETTTTVNGHALSGNVTVSAADVAAVPTTTTVNGKALSANITLGLASADFANQGTATTVLHGNAAGNPTFGAVVEADITLADNTTNDVSTTKHGLAPKGTNTGTKFLRDDATWATPASGITTVKVGTTTKDCSSTTTTTIAHGAGATPKIVDLEFYFPVAGVTSFQPIAARVSYDGTTTIADSIYVTGNISYAWDANFRLNASTNAPTTYLVGVVTVDATNITITWTKTGSPTGTYNVKWKASA